VLARQSQIRPPVYHHDARDGDDKRAVSGLPPSDPRDLRQAFAANLRRLRHAKGISQEDLAYEADVNRTYLSKLEKGVVSHFEL